MRVPYPGSMCRSAHARVPLLIGVELEVNDTPFPDHREDRLARDNTSLLPNLMRGVSPPFQRNPIDREEKLLQKPPNHLEFAGRDVRKANIDIVLVSGDEGQTMVLTWRDVGKTINTHHFAFKH